MNGKKPQWVMASLLFVLVMTMAFGGVVTAGMMTMDGRMSNCPYMGTSGLCDMNITEHLEGWQTLFATTLDGLHTTDLFPLMVFALIAPFFTLLVRKRFERPISQRWRILELFDPLKIALARGILNPKLYS